MFEKQPMKIYTVTFKKVLDRLAEVKNCPIKDFKEKVIEQFDGYNYEGEEELLGLETWIDISSDAKYELTVKIDHKDAYEFTLYVNVFNSNATIYNVL